MFEYRCKLSLCASHPNADISALPGLLQLTAVNMWRGGDPRTTPRGVSSEGINRSSYCSMQMPDESGQSLPELLRASVAYLSRHADVIEDFSARGTSFSFFVGWFSEGTNSRDVLDWQILAQLSALKISLDLDVYAPDETTHTHEEN